MDPPFFSAVARQPQVRASVIATLENSSRSFAGSLIVIGNSQRFQEGNQVTITCFIRCTVRL
ncbi:MAG: hypothetical protein K0U66_06430 [Gammaproteobacteria bacterium]|nr:hypothetical protein [Gammaproteobacteria bacterium]